MNRTVTLVKTAYEPGQLGPYERPQVALAGRSNVGKSSLINALCGNRRLAKISSTPGKTRSVNFYDVEPGGWQLVDLPGYGYARCSKTERAKWARLIEGYLADNPLLAGVAVLLDSRLEPQKLDLEMTAFLGASRIPMLAVLTKADKCKQRDRSKRQRQWRDILGLDRDPLLFSAKTGMGSGALWRALESAAVGEVPED